MLCQGHRIGIAASEDGVPHTLVPIDGHLLYILGYVDLTVEDAEQALSDDPTERAKFAVSVAVQQHKIAEQLMEERYGCD